MTVFRWVVVAMAFPLVTWTAGRVLTALAVRASPERTSRRLYLSDRVDRLRITAVLTFENELLVSLVADVPTELAVRAWRVIAEASARTRVQRWLDDSTVLRAYCSADGTIMLADPVWGGNVECEPALAVG